MGDTPNPFHPPPRQDTPRISLCEHEQDLQELASDISDNNKIRGEINYNNLLQHRSGGDKLNPWPGRN